MSESLIVAMVILIGVFVVMIVTIVRSGHEAAIQMWGVMGALTGVAFGAITTYYFTDQVHKREVAAIRADATLKQLALDSAATKASDAQSLLSPFVSAFSGKAQTSTTLPASFKYAAALPEADRDDIAVRFQKVMDLLLQVIALEAQLPNSATNAPEKK